MGKFKLCAIIFREKKVVYREGDLVSGVMQLDVLEPVTVKGVRVYCYGEALTKWSKEFTRDWNTDQVGQEKYLAQVLTVFGKKANVDGPNHTLTVGQHKWNFAFRLPAERLPSSFEGEYGAIRWFLKVEVDKPFPSINNKWFRAFTVLSALDLNEAVYKNPMSKTVTKTVSKALGLGNAGNLILSAKTDRFGYCPGESVALTVEAKNESSKDMGKVLATLVQRVVFTANDESKSTNLGMSSMETELPLAKGTTLTLTDLMLPIPAVPPSTRKRTCHIISCTYSVQVTIQVPWGLNLQAVLPIAIGTVPRGKRVPPPRRAGQSSPPRDPVTGIQYVQCVTGITPCRKYHNNFPNFPYTPQTAFVSDYVYNPNGQASPSASAQPAAVSSSAKGATPSAPPVVSGATPSTLPPYPGPSAAPPSGDSELPPSYEDVLKMDEDNQKSATPTKTATAAKAAPKGKDCAVMMIRFSDTGLSTFRDCIQREQNNLLDNEEAYLAALAPQPITGLEKPNEEWPERVALAVLVFPDMCSGEEWLSGVSGRGDNWYSGCDAIIMPAKWTVSREEAGRLILSVTAVKTREGTTKQQILAFSKNILPSITKCR
ncbi:hypothetical protein V1264_001031 [Littorina saxatilis]